MNVSKIEYNNNVLIDLTSDSVSKDNIFNNATAHAANGDIVQGNFNTLENGLLCNQTMTINIGQNLQPKQMYKFTLAVDKIAQYAIINIIDLAPLANSYSSDLANLRVYQYRPCTSNEFERYFYIAIYNHTDEVIYCDRVRYTAIMGKDNYVMIWIRNETRTYVPIPQITSEEFVYDGNEKTPTVSDYDSELIEVTITPQTDAGTYYVIAHLIDQENYVWSDGHTLDRNIEWIIKPQPIASPTVTGSFVYDGTLQSPIISSYDTSLIEMDTSSVTSARDTGTYNVIFNIADSNYTFADD